MRTAKSLLSSYNREVAINNHTEAALILTVAYGTIEEIEEMKGILERHVRQQYIDQPDYRRRYEISQKYYRILVDRAKQSLPVR